MRKCLLFLSILTMLVVGSTAALAMTVNFNSGNNLTVPLGSTFDISITANVAPSEALVGWGFNLNYNPGLMYLSNVTYGSGWDPSFLAGGDFLSALLLPGPDPGAYGDNLDLATLTFKCRQAGSSGLDITVDPNDLTQGFIKYDYNFAPFTTNPIAITQVSGQNPVPEPGTVLLVGAGLAGLVCFRRKMKA